METPLGGDGYQHEKTEVPGSYLGYSSCRLPCGGLGIGYPNCGGGFEFVFGFGALPCPLWVLCGLGFPYGNSPLFVGCLRIPWKIRKSSRNSPCRGRAALLAWVSIDGAGSGIAYRDWLNCRLWVRNWWVELPRALVCLVARNSNFRVYAQYARF